MLADMLRQTFLAIDQKWNEHQHRLDMLGTEKVKVYDVLRGGHVTLWYAKCVSCGWRGCEYREYAICAEAQSHVC